MKIDFNESDLLREVLNFKIANKKHLEKKYDFKRLEYTISNINEFLSENNTGIIHKNKDYLYYFGKYDENIFKIEDKDINLKTTFRRELILLILLFGKEKLNIYKFNKKIKRTQENNRNIQNDLRRILKKFDIRYAEYNKSENIEKLFEEKNHNLKELRERYLKEILLRRLEKNYIGKSTYQENLYIEILQETLEIKNIRYIKKLIFSYIKNFTNIISMDEKYEMLVYFLLNIKNEKIKHRYNIKRNDENEEFFIMINKISKKEKLKMNPKFILLFYKKLHKKRQKAEELIKRINERLILEREIKKIKEKEFKDGIKKDNEVGFYNIAETIINFEEKSLMNRQIVKDYIHPNKMPKITTLLLIDLEQKEILKTYNEIKKIFNFLDIVKVELLEDFKKIIMRNNNTYEQILLVSSSKYINVIKNFSEMSIYHFEIENINKKGMLRKKSQFLLKMINLRNMMIQYQKFQEERKMFSKNKKS